MLGIKGTGESSFSTESLFAFFAEGFFVDDPFNLRFCANDSSETGFGAFFADFLGFDEDVDDDDDDIFILLTYHDDDMRCGQ